MVIRPFAALRPNVPDAAKVASVPYDVVDTAEAKALAEGNPKSFLHVSRPEIDLAAGTKPDSPEAYAQARRALDAFVADGTLVRDEEPWLPETRGGGQEELPHTQGQGWWPRRATPCPRPGAAAWRH